MSEARCQYAVKSLSLYDGSTPGYISGMQAVFSYSRETLFSRPKNTRQLSKVQRSGRGKTQGRLTSDCFKRPHTSDDMQRLQAAWCQAAHFSRATRIKQSIPREVILAPGDAPPVRISGCGWMSRRKMKDLLITYQHASPCIAQSAAGFTHFCGGLGISQTSYTVATRCRQRSLS